MTTRAVEVTAAFCKKPCRVGVGFGVVAASKPMRRDDLLVGASRRHLVLAVSCTNSECANKAHARNQPRSIKPERFRPGRAGWNSMHLVARGSRLPRQPAMPDGTAASRCPAGERAVETGDGTPSPQGHTHETSKTRALSEAFGSRM